MRLIIAPLRTVVLKMHGLGQIPVSCPCGHNPPGPRSPRSLKSYSAAPKDFRSFSKFTTPYHEF
jgi:hypothetical protein